MESASFWIWVAKSCLWLLKLLCLLENIMNTKFSSNPVWLKWQLIVLQLFSHLSRMFEITTYYLNETYVSAWIQFKNTVSSLSQRSEDFKKKVCISAQKRKEEEILSFHSTLEVASLLIREDSYLWSSISYISVSKYF